MCEDDVQLRVLLEHSLALLIDGLLRWRALIVQPAGALRPLRRLLRIPELLRIVDVPKHGEALFLQAREVVVVHHTVQRQPRRLAVIRLAVEHLDAVTAHGGQPVYLPGKRVGPAVVHVLGDRRVVEAGEQVDLLRVPRLCVEALRIGIHPPGEAADHNGHLANPRRRLLLQHRVYGIEVLASEVRVAVNDRQLGHVADVHLYRSSISGSAQPGALVAIFSPNRQPPRRRQKRGIPPFGGAGSQPAK